MYGWGTMGGSGGVAASPVRAQSENWSKKMERGDKAHGAGGETVTLIIAKKSAQSVTRRRHSGKRGFLESAPMMAGAS